VIRTFESHENLGSVFGLIFIGFDRVSTVHVRLPIAFKCMIIHNRRSTTLAITIMLPKEKYRTSIHPHRSRMIVECELPRCFSVVAHPLETSTSISSDCASSCQIPRKPVFFPIDRNILLLDARFYSSKLISSRWSSAII
jgi:hypothetical protein